ncbi:MAG: PKD repeat protein [Sphingobacteriales bacterium]|jgi:PKD repeat protein
MNHKILLLALSLMISGTVIGQSKANIAACDTPIANFSSDSLGGYEVGFTDLSTPSDITKWQWDFGDRSPISTKQNPTYSYHQNGIYKVCLIVENNCATDTFCQNHEVNYCDVENVIIHGNCRGLEVVLSNSSNCNGNATVVWNMGDGITYHEQTVTHTYALPGTYNVTLSITTDSETFRSTHAVQAFHTSITSKSNKKQISLYPTATNSILNFKINKELSNKLSYQIVNQLGALIQKGNIDNAMLDVTLLKKGYYFMKIDIAGDKTLTLPFQKL